MADLLFLFNPHLPEAAACVTGAADYFAERGHQVRVLSAAHELAAVLREGVPDILVTMPWIPRLDFLAVHALLRRVDCSDETRIVLLSEPPQGAAEPLRYWPERCHSYVLTSGGPWQLILSVEQLLYMEVAGIPSRWKSPLKARLHCLYLSTLTGAHATEGIEGEALLAFDAPHLREHYDLADDLRFHFRLRGLVAAPSRWDEYHGRYLNGLLPHNTSHWSPDELPEIDDAWEYWLRPGEGSAETKVATLAWPHFRAVVAGRRFVVLAVEVLPGGERATVNVEGLLEGAHRLHVMLIADELRVERSDGEPFGLNLLIEWGRGYWRSDAPPL